MNLTASQLTLLRAIVEGKRCRFHPYMGRFNPHAHYTCPGIGSCTPSARALLRRGMVQKAEEERYSQSHILVATEAGRIVGGLTTKQ